jgi:hypothetical protein
MGLSKRNPRGNFNWQYRYLKKKAINCGQIDESFDCNIPELQPNLGPNTSQDFCTGSVAGMAWINTGLNQANGNDFVVYKDGVFYDQALDTTNSFSIVINPTSLTDEGVYECFCTNQFGCTTSSTITLSGVVTPEIDVVKTQSTIVCVDPNPTAPPPILGNGFLDFTITNFDPAYTYGYDFSYDPGVVNYNIINNSITTSTFTIDKLCNIRYFMSVYIVGSNPYCSTAFLVDLTTP